jgi:hypothetical protein
VGHNLRPPNEVDEPGMNTGMNRPRDEPTVLGMNRPGMNHPRDEPSGDEPSGDETAGDEPSGDEHGDEPS